MMLRSIAAALAIAAVAPLAAHASVLTFDDNNPAAVAYNPLPTSYHGLTWTNWATINGTSYAAANGPNGYTNGVVSSPSIACGCAGDFGQETDTISGSNISLNSGYFTSAWNDGETLTVEGFNGATLVDSTSFIINTAGPTLEFFGWSGLTSVTFTPTGGTSVGFNGSGEYFAVDNLDISGSSVPEPATWALMLAGFGGLGVTLRSRRRAAA